jgi:hypothetical protein
MHLNEIHLYILTFELFKATLPQFIPHPFPEFNALLGTELGILGQQLQTMLYTRFSFNFWATGSKCDGEISQSNTS